MAHSTNGFPVRTGEEFLEFLRAATAFASGQPEAFGSFLATHPNAKRFFETPKPIPTSFAQEAFFAVTSFKFTNTEGVSRNGRFRIRPEAGTEYLSDEDAGTKSENLSRPVLRGLCPSNGAELLGDRFCDRRPDFKRSGFD